MQLVKKNSIIVYLVGIHPTHVYQETVGFKLIHMNTFDKALQQLYPKLCVQLLQCQYQSWTVWLATFLSTIVWKFPWEFIQSSTHFFTLLRQLLSYSHNYRSSNIWLSLTNTKVSQLLPDREADCYDLLLTFGAHLYTRCSMCIGQINLPTMSELRLLCQGGG